MRRNALLSLMLLVTLLTVATLAISIYAFERQDSAMRTILKAYVADIAENYYENAPDEDIDGQHHVNELPQETHHTHHTRERRLFFQMFSTDPSMRSGGLLLLDENKRIIAGSDGAERLLHLWEDGLILGEPSEIREFGRVYYVIVKTLRNGHYVLVAASQATLMESMSRIWNFWLVSVMLTSLVILAGIIALWRCLVTPIRSIVERIGNLEWGREIPEFQTSRLFEVAALQDVVKKSASDSVDKRRLRDRYISDIVQAQENTAKRLAREIHDGPLQLAVAAIKHIQLTQDVIPPGAAEKRLETAERISQFAAKEIRHYCDELSPSWLELGLKSALEEMTERLSSTYEIGVNLTMNCKDEGISREYSLSIIRILQEAVSNSARHGNATKIDVKLTRHDDGIIFEIKDNGRGFNASEFNDYERIRLEGHRGLSNMHERVQLLGGTLDVSSAPGKGSIIHIRLN
ncbi:MAG: sensor histidine kinase [Synergistaceae bacterium]|jgi:signal transduction histidine kinase|nr:sensor histidine kinase [Synergistaceae bacterium]